MRSSIVAAVLMGTNMADVRDGAPPVRQACSLIVNSSVSLIRPSFKARNVTAAVISFEIDAGGSSSSALDWYMMAPVSPSISTAALARVVNPPPCASADSGAATTAVKSSINGSRRSLPTRRRREKSIAPLHLTELRYAPRLSREGAPPVNDWEHPLPSEPARWPRDRTRRPRFAPLRTRHRRRRRGRAARGRPARRACPNAPRGFGPARPAYSAAARPPRASKTARPGHRYRPQAW